MSVQNVDINGNTVISLFAGCGGSSLGYKLAGYKELLAIEWDQNAVETFKLNFDIPIWQKDISSVTTKEILNFCNIKKGELYCLDGSPPCQGFSTAGKRNLNDSRNDLFKEYCRLLKGLQPKSFIMENVSGMIKGKMKGKFLEILMELKNCGYNVKCKLMNAMWYNVPQSRERLIFIGTRNDLKIQPSFPRPNNKYISTQEAIGNLEQSEKGNRKLCTSGLLKYAKLLNQGESAAKYHKTGSLFGLIRLHKNKPSPTIIKSAGTGFLHYQDSLNFLSVKELQVLASFPANFNFIGNRNNKIDRIGNSVPPLMMKAIAEHLKNIVPL